MKIVSTSYTNTPGFNDPELWLERINFYTGILEQLAMHHEVESIEQINYTGALKPKGVTYHFLNFKRPKLYFPHHLHRFIKALKPDVVFVNGLIFPLQVIQLRLTLGKAIKIIVLHRGEKPYQGLRRQLQKFADKMINAYLFTSAEFGKEWTAFGNISNQNKIHEVIQASSVFYPQKKDTARSTLQVHGSPVFLWVGRLDANKDPVTVVKAFLQFSELQPAARLYMIYQEEGLLKEIKDLVQQSNKTAESIQLVGKVPHQQLQDWYNAADFIISGSHHEGSGIAVCEAMSCGCIPILTDIISFRKMTGPGPQGSASKCGLLYEPGNDAALLKVLFRAAELNKEEERKKTLEQFKSQLSFEAIAKKIETVISSV
jgi:glycosyltransferase involved in cell wall biosynthesis